MKVTTVSRLPDGTPLVGGVACLQCGTPFATDKQVSEEGFCLQCDWLMGFPESDIEVIHEGILHEVGLRQQSQVKVPTVRSWDGLLKTGESEYSFRATLFAWRKLAQLHPEAFGMFVELWYAQNGIQGPRRLRSGLGKSYAKVLDPIRRFVHERESEARRKVR